MKRWLFTILAIFVISACSPGTPMAAHPETPVAEPSIASVTQAVMPTPRSTVTPQKPSATETPPAPTATIIPGQIAREHIAYLSETIGARLADTDKEREAAQYIESVFNEIGYEAQTQAFRKMGWVGEDEIETMINSSNIFATKAGDSEKMIVIGAHYDSVADGLGADDNASGVGVLLELAERLHNVPTLYTLRFVAFGAEEVGPLGSAAYMEQISAEERQNTIAFINLDSVIAGDILYLYSAEWRGAVVRDWALAWAEANALDLQTIAHVALDDEEGYPSADYAAFRNAGIPFAYFEATNWKLGAQDGYTQVNRQYGERGAIIHTPYDRLDYLDATFPGRVDEHLSRVLAIVRAILTEFRMPE